jgi:hypothetical protein
LVARTANEFGVGFANKGVVLKPAIREVVFLDTADFRLYNNAFILRQRIAYESGFPAGEPEIVFKFRHEDMQKAAELDVRPNFAGNYRIKFKAEALPLKDQVGGISLTVLSQRAIPLGPSAGGRPSIDGNAGARVPGVGGTENFRHRQGRFGEPDHRRGGASGPRGPRLWQGDHRRVDIGIWRERGTHHPLCGEFAFQAKFKRRDEVHEKVIHRCQQFFIALQQSSYDWLFLGTTKTGLVYRLKGNPPQSHE